MSWPGSADERRGGFAAAGPTADWAARLAGRYAPAAYGPLGTTGLTVSRLGFGGYRVDDDTPVHRAALERALQAGVNLIDTSTNYADGGSERLVGAVVTDLAGRGLLRRDEIVIVSKIGYLQGGNLRLAEERERAGQPFPEVVKPGPGIWHCIHPDFLADQLARSRDRLRLATLDVCLLHNPEYFLADARRRGAGSLAARREEFARRLGAAFRFFEGEVAAGRLRWYGVSSNTAAAPLDDPEATSVTRMLEVAVEAGGPGHRFRVLQLPVNLVESAGVFEAKDGPDGRAAVLEWAAHQGLGVLVNRPLNAVVGQGMLRLADPALDPARPAVDLADQIGRVGELEAEYRRDVAPGVRVRPGSRAPEDFFRWADQLAALADEIRGLAHWEEIERRVLGLVGQAARALDESPGGVPAGLWPTWRERYLPELGRLLGELRRQAALRSRADSRAVAAAIDPHLPAGRRSEPLSRKALWVLASTPGVSTVLVGMRRPAYVDDAVGILGWPLLDAVRPVYAAVRDAGLLPASGS